MNRLWVRLSLMIAGVLFFVFFMQFLSIALPDDDAEDNVTIMDCSTGQPVAFNCGDETPHTEIARRLTDFIVLSLLVGLGGGILIGRYISRPINGLVSAARRIGQGNLDVRVPVHGSREMVELAETFNKMADELQRAETLRSNLMADVSHELRTPLTVLDGNLRATLDHIYTLDEAGVANLYGQTRHLIRLVNDLRELALAESHHLPLEKQPTDLNELLAETLQALEPLAFEKDIKLLGSTDTLPQLDIDAIRIRQVLFNLLFNALHHTSSGGEIRVRSDASRPAEITLIVEDSGDGLEADQLASVFDRFYRGDKSRSRESGSTGLGLAIVKAIVEAHGGHVEAHSQGKGCGSQFLISLPL